MKLSINYFLTVICFWMSLYEGLSFHAESEKSEINQKYCMNLMATSPLPPSLVAPSLAPILTPMCVITFFSEVSHLMQDVSHSPSPYFSCPYFTPTSPAPILPHFSCPYFTPNVCDYLFSDVSHLMQDVSHSPSPHFSCPYFTPTFPAPILAPFLMPLFYPHFSCPYFTPNVCDYLFSDVSHLMQDVSHSPSPHFSCPYFTPTFPAPILPPFLMPLFYPHFSCPYFTPMCVITFSLMYPI